ncbi:MAG TPA: LicD family protein [Firmicutes bacterium]|nr:LicD family protein [Bacillota bacterium]
MNETDRELRALQKVELGLLHQFDAICRKEGLAYFLLGGTALGAVRHGGFIPWDDDVDVGMPRPDYERFLRTAPALLPAHLFLQDYHSEPAYFLSFAKLRDNRTLFKETVSAHLPIHQGVYLDIFPLDGGPADPQEAEALLKKMKLYRFSLLNRRTDYIRKKSLPASLALSLMAPFVSRDACFRKIDALCTKYPYGSSPSVANWHGAWGTKEVVPAAFFGEGKPMPFEDMLCPVPQDYDGYLTSLYGDYRRLPPEEKRVSHHESVEIRLEGFMDPAKEEEP